MTIKDIRSSITHYPVEIKQHFKDLINIMVDTLQPTAIYLLGSAARGELSWLQHPSGQLELFSDLEFAIITKRRIGPEKCHLMQQQLHNLENQIANPNPLFHIDTLFRERRRLRTMPRIIFTFEFKANGLLLYGDDLRSAIPDVTLKNLDQRNTNEILYKRLWAILLYLPTSFVHGNPGTEAVRVTGYTLCRNALDLTTVVLPREGCLLPSYQQRVDFLVENATHLNLVQELGFHFPSFMQTCLERRRDLDFSAAGLLPPLYTTTIDDLERGLLLLMHTKDTERLPQLSQRIFNTYPISRGEWYNLLRLMLRQARRGDIINGLRWLHLPVKGWLTLGLLMMHKALICWLKGQEQDANAYLDRAEHALCALSLSKVPSRDGEFPAQWLALRRAWGEVWWQTVTLGSASAKAHIERVFAWHYD
ncbi:MAG: hypothetical protein P1S60_02545 [Anaerolineae bacterium]|nr:hypothetical protein [Anaerolineae bacterium]